MGVQVPADPAISEASSFSGSTTVLPAFRLLPRFFSGSEDWSRPYATVLDVEYDKWLAFKKRIKEEFDLDFGINYSFFPQWGSKSTPAYANVYYPYATWRPFTDSFYGSGEINVVTSHKAYFSRQNSASQAARLGLITLPNDWTKDGFAWSILDYIHTFAGQVSWLSFTFGQYNLSLFDPSQFAANAQTGFISYSFAQNATQTFPNGGFGGYARAKTIDGLFNFAAGAQDGTDLNGGTLTTFGLGKGRLVKWGNAQWTPNITGFGYGIYSLMLYEQPFVPKTSSRSIGVTLSASQDLTSRYGAFLRVNSATGSDIPIRTSYAGGVIWNNPIRRNHSDQLGFAVGWNKTNHAYVGLLRTRGGEWVTELFYRATIFRGMHITPDVQLFWNPALVPNSPESVFTMRTTVMF